ncbi:unnamed protein product, partial [Polarella glacialis]
TGPATALLAVGSRVRRVALSQVTLVDLRKSLVSSGAVSSRTVRIAAEPDGSAEVLSDAQLCQHV